MLDSSFTLGKPLVVGTASLLILYLSLLSLSFHMLFQCECRLNFAISLGFAHSISQTFVLLLVFRLCNHHFLSKLLRVYLYFRQRLLFAIKHFIVFGGSVLFLNLSIAAHKFDLSVHLRKVDQMEVFLHFLSFLCFLHTFHVH